MWGRPTKLGICTTGLRQTRGRSRKLSILSKHRQLLAAHPAAFFSYFALVNR